MATLSPGTSNGKVSHVHFSSNLCGAWVAFDKSVEDDEVMCVCSETTPDLLESLDDPA